MNSTPSRYAQWKAPAEDGQLLIWPTPAQILIDAQENRRRLQSASDVRIDGVALPELRKAARTFIGHGDDQPLIVTGHQTELYHPGVWVKNALIHRIAEKLSGWAGHFAVDTDAPKHLHVRWPGGSQEITDDPAITSAPWSALLRCPTPRYLQELRADFDREAATWEFQPVIDSFFDSLGKSSVESPSLGRALTDAVHELDRSLGLRYDALTTSGLWLSEPYLLYVHHILRSAGDFAATYNQALAGYRNGHGLKTSVRPMPDLRVTPQSIEIPFWLDDLAGQRRDRAKLEVSGEHYRLRLVSGAVFEIDGKRTGWQAAADLADWCRRHQVRLAPRALTMTLFFRLCLTDQFVHGIGGGRYDQVTDDVIQRHFGFEPPKFAVTTATLYFPAALGQRRINLRPMLQEGRRIRHGLLSKDKLPTVRTIETLPRYSRQRQDLFFDMHRRLAAESNGPAVQEWERRFLEIRRESLRQRELFDREIFFAIQPRDRLEQMIDRCRTAFS
jgi:hypothetical protein